MLAWPFWVLQEVTRKSQYTLILVLNYELDLECQFCYLYFQDKKRDTSWMVRAEKAKVSSTDNWLFTVLYLNLNCVYSNLDPVRIQMTFEMWKLLLLLLFLWACRFKSLSRVGEGRGEWGTVFTISKAEVPLHTLQVMHVFSQQASRSALHKASIRGQYETVKKLLGDGEDVDQRDQVSFSLHLYK